MRGLIPLALAAVVVTSCDRVRSMMGDSETEPQLAFSLEMSDVLDWGGVSDVVLTLTNQDTVPVGNIDVELYFPSWLSFSSVEPASTEVSMLSTEGETRLSYGLGEPPLEPGETRTIVQSVRVPQRGEATGVATGAAVDPPVAPVDTGAVADTLAAVPGAADTASSAAEAVDQVPTNRMLRARLVARDGRQLGAEVRTLMPFQGADNTAALPTAASTEVSIDGEGVGPVRLGASPASLRAAVSSARDTTFDMAGGPRADGMVVPLDGGRTVLVSVVNDGVERIIVRDARVQTELDHGVGSTFRQLRQSYGNHCSLAVPGGRTAVRFDNLRGVSFIFDGATTAADTTVGAPARVVPDGGQVREIWVQRTGAGC
jgi:hypothetical protein